MAISARVQRILSEMEALSAAECNELRYALLGPEDDDPLMHGAMQTKVQDIEENQWPASTEEAGAEWRRAIHRRGREIDEGKVQLVEEDDFLRDFRTWRRVTLARRKL